MLPGHLLPRKVVPPAVQLPVALQHRQQACGAGRTGQTKPRVGGMRVRKGAPCWQGSMPATAQGPAPPFTRAGPTLDACLGVDAALPPGHVGLYIACIAGRPGQVGLPPEGVPWDACARLQGHLLCMSIPMLPPAAVQLPGMAAVDKSDVRCEEGHTPGCSSTQQMSSPARSIDSDLFTAPRGARAGRRASWKPTT